MPLQTELLKKKQEEQEKRRQESGKVFFDLKDGKNVIRILPRSLKYFSKEGDDDFAVRYLVHYNMFEVSGYKMILCSQTKGEACPICEYVNKATDKVVIGKIRHRERYMYNVWDQADGKVKILETGPKIYEEVLKFVVSPEWGDLFGLVNGRMITVERIPKEKSGTGWAEYAVVPSPQLTNISELLPEGWDAEVDSLVSKIPEGSDQAKLGYLVECFTKGVAPVTGQEDQKVGAAQALKPQVGGQQAQSTSAVAAAPVQTQAQVPTMPLPPVSATVKVGTPGCQFGPQPDPKFPAGTYPYCFAKEYSPRQEKCKTCWAKPECRAEFLKG